MLFYLEHAISKKNIVQICKDLTHALPDNAWVPQARVDGFVGTSDTCSLRIGCNNGAGWKWPQVSSQSTELWAADETIAISSGCHYHMKFHGLSIKQRRTVKNILKQHGFSFHKGKLSAWREMRLGLRHRIETDMLHPE